MGYLISSKSTPSFKRIGVDDYLSMGLKGYAMLNELLPLIGRSFELANLRQLGTNISDGINGTRTQSFDVLSELQKPDKQDVFR